MDENFFKRLLATYKIEAQEHLEVMTTDLVSYENSKDETERKNYIENVYRAAHSLKGASRAVNYLEIESICKNLEYIFAALKKDELESYADLFDKLYKAFDLITLYLNTEDDTEKLKCKDEIVSLTAKLVLDTVKENQPGKNGNANEDKTKDGKANKETETGENKKEPVKTVPAERVSSGSDIIRVSASRLDSIFLQSEQMLTAKLSSEQTTNDLKQIQSSLDEWKREWNKVNSYYKRLKSAAEKEKTSSNGTKSDENTKFLAFIEKNNDLISSISDSLKKITKAAHQNNRSFGTMLNELTDDLKQILMLPYSSMIDPFTKLVRDLSRDLNKDVNLEVTGAEIQADRRILEEMRDPFIHLVRNSIDHGIEIPAERIRKKKDIKGRIRISFIKLEGNKIEIIFEDDGKGIDIAALKRTAVEKDIITREQAKTLNDEEALELMFHSGMSTSRVITDISGHGLGLAIVREKVEKLGGIISVQSEADKGTKFIMTLPHTLATFRGIVVSCADRLFALPAVNIETVLLVNSDTIRTVENKETISVNGIPISLVFLSDLLELHRKGIAKGEMISVVILQLSGKRIAGVVDRILYEHEILVKPFNKQLARLRNISGAAVLGDGKIVPVLNASDLIKSAEKYAPAAPVSVSATTEEEAAFDRSILVVDDSITSRMLLKDILESAGYNVKTAIDGIDAMTSLKVDDFDLVVSDIEMPRMDGFELCRTIRSDERLSDIPVVLVTALAKREDREKGIDSGANAYIVKSNFDQSNLLETVKRLL